MRWDLRCRSFFLSRSILLLQINDGPLTVSTQTNMLTGKWTLDWTPHHIFKTFHQKYFGHFKIKNVWMYIWQTLGKFFDEGSFRTLNWTKWPNSMVAFIKLYLWQPHVFFNLSCHRYMLSQDFQCSDQFLNTFHELDFFQFWHSGIWCFAPLC